jgi:hypothetical protein
VAPVVSTGKESTGEGSDKPAERLARRIEEGLHASSLPHTMQAEYRQACAAVTSEVSQAGLHRVAENVKEFRFYRTHEELTEAFRSKYPKAKIHGVLKGCFDRDGTIHLDGGGTKFGQSATLAEFYAHELTHAIDGNNHEISDSEAWKKAWNAERDFLNANGRKKPSEGFAEFGEMILGRIVSRTQMKDAMPKCLKIWEKNKL